MTSQKPLCALAQKCLQTARCAEKWNSSGKLNRGDGPQSLIALPESPVRSRKKAEIEFQTLKCIANCELIPSETAAAK